MFLPSPPRTFLFLLFFFFFNSHCSHPASNAPFSPSAAAVDHLSEYVIRKRHAVHEEAADSLV